MVRTKPPGETGPLDWGIESVRERLAGRALTKRRLIAAGIDLRGKGKWGRYNEHLLGIPANSSPLPDLGDDGELKTTVRDRAGNFREALRICVVGHDPLIKLRKIVLVIARDRSDAQRFEEREVVNEDVVLLEPTTVIQRALEYDCDLLRRDPRAAGTYFLETHPQGSTRAYYVKKARLQEYVEHVPRITEFRKIREVLKGRRITAADLRRADYAPAAKGRFGNYVRGLLDESLREGVHSGVIDKNGEAKEDLVLCPKEADPIEALRRIIYTPMRVLRPGGHAAEESRDILDVVFLAPTELVLHVLERDRSLIRRGRGAEALFLRLKTRAPTGMTGWAWYLKAKAVSLYAAVLRNQPL
jgi:hypothetical protein